jgi:hypothetical protein
MQFSAVDQGGGETYGGAISFKADKVSPKKSIATSDHSTAQDQWENHRVTKYGWEVTVETKLYAQTAPSTYSLLAALQSNDLGKIVVTATGAGVIASGVITNVDVDYAGPSTLRFTLKSHGSAIVWA